MKKIVCLLVSTLVILAGCSLNSKTYKEIKSSGQKLDLLSVSVGDYETLAGTWVSESEIGEEPMVLTIDSKGVVKIFYSDKTFANKGELVISNDETWAEGYITANLKGKSDGEPINIYATGREGTDDIEYSATAKHIYLIEGNELFERDKVGFDYTRSNEYTIEQQIPSKITKDTLIFQEFEKDEDEGYDHGYPLPLNYLVFHRKNELNSKQDFEKSTINFKELRDENFTSISGKWISHVGFSLNIDSSGYAIVNGDERKKGKLDLSSSDRDSGGLVIDSGQWTRPLFANGDVGIEDDVIHSSISIIKSGEQIGTTSHTELYDYFNQPDVPPYLNVANKDVILLTAYYSTDENEDVPSFIYMREEDVQKNSSKVGIDGESIINGDFSSLVGTWGIPSAQGLGTRLRIDNNGILYWDTDTEGQPIGDIVKVDDGSFWGVVGEDETRESAPNSAYINFFPAGVVAEGGENSDDSKDRIAFGGSVTNYNDPYVFYRLDE